MTFANFKKTGLVLMALVCLTVIPVHGANSSSDDVASETTLSSEEAQQFIEAIGNEIITILANKQKSLEQRKQNFRVLLTQKFNINAIGKFVLGRYWRQLQDGQTDEYLNLFQDSIVESYAAQFDKYSNQKLKVLSASTTDRGSTLVKTEVIQPRGGEPLKVDWQIFKKPKTGIKIYDIIINGVSMSITQRNEYASLIQSKGKGISGLLEYMRSNHQVISPVEVKDKASGKS